MPEFYYDYNYIFREPKFNHRDAMKDAALSLNGKKGVGASIGLRLYNKSIVYYNTYVHAYKNPEKYFTKDIMDVLDEAAKKEFSYGGGVEEIETGENNG